MTNTIYCTKNQIAKLGPIKSFYFRIEGPLAFEKKVSDKMPIIPFSLNLSLAVTYHTRTIPNRITSQTFKKRLKIKIMAKKLTWIAVLMFSGSCMIFYSSIHVTTRPFFVLWSKYRFRKQGQGVVVAFRCICKCCQLKAQSYHTLDFRFFRVS